MEKDKIKILLVDDDEEARSTYREIFEKQGMEVIEAKDGLEGLDLATKQFPNIILSGIIMPRMDGFSFKEALEKNINTSQIPFMILSHMGREEDRIKAEKLGIKDFLVFGLITPLQIVEKIKAKFSSGEYSLHLDPDKLDAPRLTEDFHLKPGIKCPQCLENLTLEMKATDISRREFSAKLICPKCGKF